MENKHDLLFQANPQEAFKCIKHSSYMTPAFNALIPQIYARTEKQFNSFSSDDVVRSCWIYAIHFAM